MDKNVKESNIELEKVKYRNETKEKIIKMIKQISDPWILNQISRCIKNITKETN